MPQTGAGALRAPGRASFSFAAGPRRGALALALHAGFEEHDDPLGDEAEGLVLDPRGDVSDPAQEIRLVADDVGALDDRGAGRVRHPAVAGVAEDLAPLAVEPGDAHRGNGRGLEDLVVVPLDEDDLVEGLDPALEREVRL